MDLNEGDLKLDLWQRVILNRKGYISKKYSLQWLDMPQSELS